MATDQLPAKRPPVEVIVPLEERARRINQHMEDAAIEVGHELIAAREEHPGTFTAWVTAELPFGIDTAERIMAIARCTHLDDPDIRAELPSAYSALYQLSRPPVERLREGIANGAVHPDMTYKEAAEWASQTTNGHRPPVDLPDPQPSPLRQGPKMAAEALAESLMRYTPTDLSDQMLVAVRRWAG